MQTSAMWTLIFIVVMQSVYIGAGLLLPLRRGHDGMALFTALKLTTLGRVAFTGALIDGSTAAGMTRTAATFSDTLWQEVDRNDLRKQLLEVADDTMRLRTVSLWLNAASQPGGATRRTG